LKSLKFCDFATVLKQAEKKHEIIKNFEIWKFLKLCTSVRNFCREKVENSELPLEPVSLEMRRKKMRLPNNLEKIVTRVKNLRNESNFEQIHP